MKKVFYLFLLIFSYRCAAQNYQCLQAGVKHFFTNGNGYLRGIRIDSVRTYTDSVIYYPFHTLRKGVDPFTSPVPDHNGGSWLGKKVIALPDGTTLFANIWKDTVVIRTHANVGESWVFYSDTSNQYYTATVTGNGTMSVLGVLDSVKTLTIQAYMAGVLNPADQLNNLKILLSKNHGFVQAFDLYTFPYHFGGWVDYFYQKATNGSLYNGYWSGISFSSAAQFNLVNFYNPEQREVYDFNSGDEFEYQEHTNINPYGSCAPVSDAESGYRVDTVISRANTAYSVHNRIANHDFLDIRFLVPATREKFLNSI